MQAPETVTREDADNLRNEIDRLQTENARLRDANARQFESSMEGFFRLQVERDEARMLARSAFYALQGSGKKILEPLGEAIEKWKKRGPAADASA